MLIGNVQAEAASFPKGNRPPVERRSCQQQHCCRYRPSLRLCMAIRSLEYPANTPVLMCRSGTAAAKGILFSELQKKNCANPFLQLYVCWYWSQNLDQHWVELNKSNICQMATCGSRRCPTKPIFKHLTGIIKQNSFILPTKTRNSLCGEGIRV